MSVAESSDRFREVFVATTPVVDDLRPRNSSATRYLHSIDEIVDVHFQSHGTNTTRGVRVGGAAYLLTQRDRVRIV
jgi:hypothetical protein